MKKVTVLMTMLALMMFSAVPAFASHNTSVESSIVQSGGASVTIGDENEASQSVFNLPEGSTVTITGDRNDVSVDQSIEQNAFSPEVETDLFQSVAQAFAFSWWR